MESLSNSPRGAVLNEVLQAIRLRSAVYCRAHWTASWGYSTKGANEPRFHFLTSGRCWIELRNFTEPTLISEGDLVIVAPGESYNMRDDPDSPLEPLTEVLERRSTEEKNTRTLLAGNGGESTTMLCGGFRLEESKVNPLI